MNQKAMHSPIRLLMHLEGLLGLLTALQATQTGVDSEVEARLQTAAMAIIDAQQLVENRRK